MPAKDLGTKFNCFKCQTKFYDLKKPEPICPKCGADQRDVPVVKTSRRTKEKEPVVVAPEVAEPAEDDEAETEDEAVAEEETDDEEPEGDF